MSLRDRIAQSAQSSPQPAATPPPESASLPATEPARLKTGALASDDYVRLKKWLLGKIAGRPEDQADLRRTPAVTQMLRERFDLVFGQAGVNLPGEVVNALFEEVVDEIVGYGPIEKLLGDSTVTEVMVNSAKQVYVERKGKLVLSDVTFEDDDHIERVIERILHPLGRRVDRKLPMADARLPDGSRVNIIIPPSAIDGPTITIRKFSTKKLIVEDLISFGSMTPEIAEFLRACVVSRLNIVVSGGTGSGKTTLLNVLSSMIPEDERVITLEDSAELQLHQPHVVRLEARPPDPDGTGGETIRDLMKNSLRMRPDRIVVGEIRSGEALDMLQAMNTGHDGSLTTLHANNPREAIARIETMSLMGGLEIPLKVIRESVAKAVDMIVQQARLDDGSRKITYITEVSGMEGESVVTQDIFKYDPTLGPDGQPRGMKPTGLRPFFTPRLESHGFKLPPEIFGASAADITSSRRR
ncbi:MAG: CpaF family protein [Chloroflexota bacterium]